MWCRFLLSPGLTHSFLISPSWADAHCLPGQHLHLPYSMPFPQSPTSPVIHRCALCVHGRHSAVQPIHLPCTLRPYLPTLHSPPTFPTDAHSVFMDDTLLSNTFTCQPEERNMHGRIFGGFLMRWVGGWFLMGGWVAVI